MRYRTSTRHTAQDAHKRSHPESVSKLETSSVYK
jgi:hypothetical protein